ncbi:MAG: M20 family metallopeptidase [Candidatus Parvarchaeota archaeon]|nr:M20 family metallopeptidase [Candidatus Jingweiarchaeum tengchongense]MCW1298054.1 M20 family metallopeptidase [Candidatus Jingweiarchaeum tengchongense]MCW1300146.1 M20 family metallopeptidase [Candidatus Jingweiarchaeum tengchongense]MCW1310908.1 M20 family metallopeptidase [Candidatus Jingweiarchaeum tengchongense]
MDATTLAKILISINTENPPGNEKEMVKFLTNFLEKEGFSVYTQNVNGRENVIAYSSKPKDAVLMLNAHMDTVPIGEKKNWKFNPLGEIKGKKLYGRGACDVKGAMAAAIIAGMEAIKEKLDKGFVFVFTCDEETLSEGAICLAKNKRKFLKNVKYAIITEPTNLKIVSCHKGVIQFLIKFFGKSAHASKPENGVNAIYNAVDFIREIRKFYEKVNKSHYILGKPTFNVGIIKGGSKSNVVPNYCEIEIDRRIIPGENLMGVKYEFEKIIKKLRDKNKNFKAEIDVVTSHPAFFTPEKSDIVKNVSAVLKKLKMDANPIGVSYYTEAEIFSRTAKIDSIVIGPGNAKNAHTVDEFIKISDIQKAKEIYKEIIFSFCKN